MLLESYLRIYITPDDQNLLLISNDGRCLELALSVVQASDEVDFREFAEVHTTDYLDMTTSFEGNYEPEHILYRYYLTPKYGVDARRFADRLEAKIERVLAEHHIPCEVVFVEDV